MPGLLNTCLPPPPPASPPNPFLQFAADPIIVLCFEKDKVSTIGLDLAGDNI